MKLLIVDDEVSAIRAVECMIGDRNVGITKIYTASGAREAREILYKEPIDIVLSDIEMPKESGLKLLSWMREEYPEVSTAFMTCYADFSYAREALKMGCEGYLLKPLDPDELLDLLAKIIADRKKKEKEKEKVRKFDANADLRRREFIKDLFYVNIPSKEQEIEEELIKRDVSLSKDWYYCPVLLMVRRWGNAGFKKERSLIRHKAEELLTVIRQDTIIWQNVIHFGENSHMVICVSKSEEGLFEYCRQFAAQYANMILNFASVRLIAYVGNVVPLSGVASEMEKLFFMDGEHLEDHGVVLYTEEQNLIRMDEDATNRFARFGQLLEGERHEQLKKEMYDYLDYLDATGGLNRRQFYYFHSRFLNLLSRYMQERNMQASMLTQDEETAQSFEQALRNIHSMKAWIDVALKRLRDLHPKKGQINDPVEETIRFIQMNLNRELDMAEIAENVHLNQDYLTRIFKKSTGLAVKNYVTVKKMERAAGLLEFTDLPIAEVAYQVGYLNYTSFNRAFKKQYEESPQIYRQVRKK